VEDFGALGGVVEEQLGKGVVPDHLVRLQDVGNDFRVFPGGDVQQLAKAGLLLDGGLAYQGKAGVQDGLRNAALAVVEIGAAVAHHEPEQIHGVLPKLMVIRRHADGQRDTADAALMGQTLSGLNRGGHRVMRS
jgi:hypothetical protein